MGITSNREPPKRLAVELKPRQVLTVTTPPPPPAERNSDLRRELRSWMVERREHIQGVRASVGIEKQCQLQGQLYLLAELRRFLDRSRKR